MPGIHMTWLIVGETHERSELCCWRWQLLLRRTVAMYYMVDFDAHQLGKRSFWYVIIIFILVILITERAFCC